MREADRDLRAVRGDDHGDNENIVGEMDTIDHQHRGIQRREVTRKKLGHCSLGRCDEPARHRRFRDRPGLQSLADRLANKNVTSSSDTSQHPFHDDLLQKVIGSEHVPRVRANLTATIYKTAPRPLDTDLATTKHDLASRGSMPVPDTVRVLRMLRADQPGQFLLEERTKHRQASSGRERQQALPHRFRDRCQHNGRFRRHTGQQPGHIRTNDTNNRYLLLHGDPFSGLSVLADPRTLP